jgi:integrating conjugative element protein (TIGR03755 family)
MTTPLRWTLIACLLIAAQAQAQDRPRSQSALYYRMGGGDPAARASNPKAISVKLGLGGNLKLNYSCGKFDVGLSWANMMNGFSKLGSQVTGAIKAGISALPMYIFQRAQPGLYELLQTYSQKADVMVSAALKSCEEMEAQIRAGGDPYEEWLGLAKGEAWKVQANTNGDIVDAKEKVETNAGRNGAVWIGGTRQGGQSQPPILLVKDLVTAGYNVTMNQPVLTGENTDYQAAAPALAQTKLAKSFRRPADASKFAQDVLGDLLIGTCDDAACPQKGTATGLGLSPKFEAEIPAIEATINALVTSSNPNYAMLDDISAPGVAIGREVVDALRELPPFERSIAMQRLTKEIALARTIDKALTVRNLLLTSITLPEVTAATVAVAEAQKKVSTLNRYIDDLLFENRVRKEVVSDTATALLQAYRTVQSQSVGNGSQRRVDPALLRDGRVQ